MRSHHTDFGQLLRGYRGRSGLTQQELAELAGLSVTGISELERGVHPTLHSKTVHRLAKALRLRPDEQAAFETAAYRPSVTVPESERDQPISLNAALQA